jgi:hypothetical protein
MVQSESQAGHMGRMESLQQPFPRAPVWVKPGSQGRGGGEGSAELITAAWLMVPSELDGPAPRLLGWGGVG